MKWRRRKSNIFEIDKITYYKTQDGESFETYEEAEEHNKTLIEKAVPVDEISMFDIYGKPVPVEYMLNYDFVYYVCAYTDNGARFLENFIGEHISQEEDIKIELNTLYRYSDEEERWISQEEDLDEFNSHWAKLIEARY